MRQRGQDLGSVSSDPLAIFFFSLILTNLSSCFRKRGKDRLLPACRIASKPPVRVSLEDLSLTIKNMFGGFALYGNCNLA